MIKSLLEQVSSYRALVLGDGIIDEYAYVKPQGKSPKENIITNRVLHTESFRGGVYAAAEHVKGFCASVDVIQGEEVVVKRRYVEETYLQKLFEVHDSREHAQRVPFELCDYDIVIVTDFGHGCVTPEMISELCLGARFLAVNAQTNSANHGFNLITKYPHADYVVIDELEARLAAQERDRLIEYVIEKLGFKRIIVTLGPNGAIGYDGGKFVHVQARAHKVIDTMGAGDAFFCVTAPFAAAGADIETLCEIGNAAGALKCATVGHRQPVTRDALLNYLAPAASGLALSER